VAGPGPRDWTDHTRRHCPLTAYSIIGSGSGFTVNLGSASLGKSNDFRSVGVSDSLRIQIHCESWSGSDNRIRPKIKVESARAQPSYSNNIGREKIGLSATTWVVQQLTAVLPLTATGRFLHQSSFTPYRPAVPFPKSLLSIFGRLFVKRFALCYRTVVCPACL